MTGNVTHRCPWSDCNEELDDPKDSPAWECPNCGETRAAIKVDTQLGTAEIDVRPFGSGERPQLKPNQMELTEYE